MSNPRLSICIPTYNRAEMLRETLGYILNQTYSDFELVIADNHSSDHTEDVVRSIADPRIRFVRNPSNCGLILNQNRAIEEGRGEYIAVYHDHDIYDRDLVRRSMEILDENPRVGIVCSAIHLVPPDNPDHVIRTDIQPWDWVTPGMKIWRGLLHEWNNFIPSPTAMVRRVCYEQAGMFRPEFGGGCDRELWMRILRNWDLGYIREPLARLRDRRAIRNFTPAQAEDHWDTLRGQVRIQSVHLEDVYREAPLRRAWERWVLRRMAFSEFWKWGLWAIAKGESEAFMRCAAQSFRCTGMPLSARVFESLDDSSLGARAVSVAFRAYKTVVA